MCARQPHRKHITATAAATPDWMQTEGGSGERRERERGKERTYRPCQIKPWGPGQWRPFLHYKYAALLQVRVWCLELWTTDCTSPSQEILILSQACHYASGGCWPQTGLQRCPFQTKEEQSEEQVWGKNICLLSLFKEICATGLVMLYPKDSFKLSTKGAACMFGSGKEWKWKLEWPWRSWLLRGPKASTMFKLHHCAPVCVGFSLFCGVDVSWNKSSGFKGRLTRLRKSNLRASALKTCLKIGLRHAYMSIETDSTVVLLLVTLGPPNTT